MTQEDKELLLKDLCDRLPYGVICLADIDKTFDGGVISKINVINLKKDWLEFENIITPFHLDEVKPYLRPMSSMTEEERKEYELLANHCIVTSIGFIHLEAAPLTDWLNAHYFDYRGLIEKGLAIAVTEENNPYVKNSL